ncbi:lasso peptide biosynthesis PqqD family chaperone [Streptomyces sp. TS71-3]|uniref:lasso peptide biosynthesis PqqD family chaperone n=1 Tax=Streptomyces sp. TS71-3 TaxID=2733862 RepID=UPI001B2ABA0C|nr:lasso peptide biosynthesis PqqD family chaperone [Streptomyces sp. TS71-3]GHJ37486.1 hypothetical protein Sm713_30950 [Streptomyces sp. TS71-3]
MGEWFVVLPDSDRALPAARALLPRADDIVEHASGRPWLVGHWPDGRVTVAAAGSARVAVIGFCPLSAASLSRRLAGVRSVEGAQAVVSAAPGCFHLVASVGGRVRAQGSLASVRRMVHCRFRGAAIGADSARVLARLTGADWDPAWLALRLALRTTPFPLHESTPWRGVRAVPGDHWLALEPDGSASTRRRWTPPDPALALAEGAPLVREALAAAVAARTAESGTVSVDLSDGVEAAGLAFLAARGPAELVTHRWAEPGPGGEHVRYASLVAATLPAARHRAAPLAAMAPEFAGLGPDAPSADLDEPFAWLRGRARLAELARAMAAEGSRVHLAGHGGQELFRPGGTYVHDLVRTRPGTALRHLHGLRAGSRGPWAATLRALADCRSPAREMRDHAAALTAPWPGGSGTAFTWSPPPRLPGWVTGDAADAARGLLLAAAREPVAPLAAQRAQHEALLRARATGAAARLADRLTMAGRMRFTLPYLDDEVLGAVLAVRLEERCPPREFKPLLAAALRGAVPEGLLLRAPEGEPGFGRSAEAAAGLLRHRAELLALFDGSELARHGLVDDAEVRQALLRPGAGPPGAAELDATLACESWLRALAAEQRTARPAERVPVGLRPAAVPSGIPRPGTRRPAAGAGRPGRRVPRPAGAPLTLYPHVSAVATAGGMVLWDRATGRYWQLNASAALVVRTLLDGANPEEAAGHLAATHPPAAPHAKQDVAGLLAQLHSARLAVPSGRAEHRP